MKTVRLKVGWVNPTEIGWHSDNCVTKTVSIIMFKGIENLDNGTQQYLK